MKSNRLLTKLVAALAFLIAPAADAGPAAPTPKDESVVQLSPFQVTNSSDVGYQANDTLAGSRLNTALKDVAASISVFTEEFMKDINATDLKDVLAYGINFQPDMDDAGSFGDNSSGNSIMGSNGFHRTRGLRMDIARNYFKWQNPTDVYNLGRVEDSRGPNSVLFGIGNAGGIVNIATKQAQLKRTIREVSLSAGSFSTWRATLDVNQPLGDKAAIRFNGVANMTGSFQAHKYSESRRAHLAAKYEITRWLMTRVEYEVGEVEANSGRLTGTSDFVTRWLRAGRPLFDGTAPTTAFAALGSRLTTANLSSLSYISNSDRLINLGGQIATTGNGTSANGNGFPILDKSIISFSVNSGGPGQVRTNPYSNISAIATSQLGTKTFIEIGVNRQRYRFSSMDPVFSHQLYGDANTNLPGALGVNPYAGRLYMETYWRRWNADNRIDTLRLSLSHELDTGKWGRYRGGVFGEIERQIPHSDPQYEVFGGTPFSTSPELNQVRRRTYVTEGDWGSYYVNSPTQTGLLSNMTDPISGRSLSSSWITYNAESNDPTSQSNVMGMLQGYWFGGRLVAGAGWRKDRLEVDDYGQVRAPVTNRLERAPTFLPRLSKPQTRTLGVVWHAAKQISFKYNQATNTNTVNSADRIFPSTASTSIAPPPSRGTGRDYGVSVSLLHDKFFASLVRYSTVAVGETFSGGATHNAQQRLLLDALLNNRLITAADYTARRSTATATTRGKRSDGYELSLTANPGNWRLSINASVTDGVDSELIPDVVAWWAENKAYFLKFPQNVQTGIGVNTIADEIALEDDNIDAVRSVEGVGLVGNVKYKGNFFARYTVKQGFLKGAFAGGGYTYMGKMLVGKTIDGTNRLQYSPPVGQAALLLGYERRVTDRARLSVQLNVSNLFDETDPRVIRYNNTGDTSLIKRIAVREPRVWTLSTRLSF